MNTNHQLFTTLFSTKDSQPLVSRGSFEANRLHGRLLGLDPLENSLLALFWANF